MVDITPSPLHDSDMHRTTINLDEAVYRRVKKLAQRKGKSLARAIEDLLRVALGSGTTVDVALPLHRGNGPLPGVDIADRERLYDLMEQR
jgi:Arc/MetJ family transcription regulator